MSKFGVVEATASERLRLVVESQRPVHDFSQCLNSFFFTSIESLRGPVLSSPRIHIELTWKTRSRRMGSNPNLGPYFPLFTQRGGLTDEINEQERKKKGDSFQYSKLAKIPGLSTSTDVDQLA